MRNQDLAGVNRLARLVSQISEANLNWDRRLDFFLLSQLTVECLQTDKPLDTAYQVVTNLYINYVKRCESASAFRQFSCFAMQLSRSLSSLPQLAATRLPQPETGTAPFTLFLIDTDAWLGHLQVLGSFLQLCSTNEKRYLEVIALSGTSTSKWARLLKQLGVSYGHIPKGPIHERLQIIRQRVENLQNQGFAVRLIWITWPPLVFLGGLKRLAPTQIAWSMKYPFQIGLHYDEIIYAYGFGERRDQKIYLHDSFTSVRLLPFSLTQEILQASDQSIPIGITERATGLMMQFKRKPGHIAILSVARPEKMCNEKFLARLSGLLSQNPKAHFFWCGKEGSLDAKGFQSQLIHYQLQQRSTLLGWVHPWPVISQCDYFLDTYPFGSGVTMAQALRLRKSILIHQPKPTANRLPEQMLIEEPNFNSLLVQIASQTNGRIYILNENNIPHLKPADPSPEKSLKTHESETSSWDPFEPSIKTHRLMVKRLLGIGAAGE
jgi:hypothetical protein